MAPSKLLLVDSDARSVRVLEVSLKKAGFEVATSSSVEGALRLAEQLVPDLVVTETQLPDHTGFMLCQQLRAAPATSHTGVLFLSEAADAQTKVEAINVGADVFLAKPVLVKDIIVQIQSILEKRQTDSIARRERPGNLSGTLANMGVVDLLQIMEAGKKSGIVHVSSDPLKSGGYVAEGHERGTIFFRDGQVIDSRLGKLRGVEAVYRMLLWDDGVFEIEFKQVSRDNVVRSTTQSILLEGMRRVDEWSRFAKRLPPLNSRLAVDFDTLNKAFSGVPADVKPVLHLFDGKRTLFEVVADAPVGDTEALEVVARLNDNGVLQNAPAPAASSSIPAAESQVEEWLSGPASPARALPGELPSALGRAVIPSRETPSQILAAAPVAPEDEAEALTPVPSATAIPEPIPDQPSLVLSRHTVPANRAVPLTSTPAAPAEPIPLTQPTGTPKLRIQRVASTLSAPARAATGEIRAPLPRSNVVSSRPSSRASSASVALAEPPVETPTLTDVPFSQTEAIEEAVRVAAAAPEPARHSVGQRGGSYIVAPAAPPPWPVARTPEPVTEDESEAPTPTPRPAVVQASSDIAPTRVPAPSEVTLAAPAKPAGFVSAEAPPAHDPTHLETPAPAKPAPAKPVAVAPSAPPVGRELSNFNDAFFNKGQDDDLTFESDEPAWKRRLPGFMLVGAVVLVVVVLAAGGRKHEEIVDQPQAQPQAAKRQAKWPDTPPEGVEISEQPTAAQTPAPEGALPAAANPEAPAPAPAEGQPVAAAPAAVPAAAPAAAPTPAAPTPVAAPAVAPTPAPTPAAAPAPKEAAAAADPEKAKALVAEGAAALARERYRDARTAYNQALEADPNSGPALAGLAEIAMEEGKLKYAKGLAWRAVKADPATPRAHLVLGLLAQEEGKTDQAKASYKRFLKYEPTGDRAEEVKRILENLP